jgi:hypothetical protein
VVCLCHASEVGVKVEVKVEVKVPQVEGVALSQGE